MDNSFLKYEISPEIANDLGLSPIIENNYRGTIQLLPNDTQPYIQITNRTGGFTFDPAEYKAFIRVCRDGFTPALSNIDYEETEITQYVLATSFDDADGFQQAYIRYAAIPFDFGERPVMIRFQRGIDPNINYYTNLFYLSQNNAHLTTRLDYLAPYVTLQGPAEAFFTLLSTRLRMYYLGYESATEIDAYYQVTTEQNVNSRILQSGLSRWYMPPTNEWIFKRLESACYGGGFYLNLVRQYLVDALEYAPPEIQTINVSEQEFTTDPNEADVFVPVYTNPADTLLDFLASNDNPQVTASSELLSSLEEYY